MLTDREALVAMSHYIQMTPKSIERLSESETRASDVWIDQNLSAKIFGESFVAWQKDFNLDQALEKIQTLQLKTTTWLDDDYPELLRQVPKPPLTLFYYGELAHDWSQAIAIVGSRHPSASGAQATSELAGILAAAGYIIVSGLALGVDALAHRAAVNANTPTIAVLGSGLDSDNFYPGANKPLGRDILKTGGAVLSEFPPGTEVQKYHFPRRNRIIAGLSLGTLVTEAAEKSGSLITATYALEFNREVMAVPNSIFQSRALGSNTLIQKGARCILKAEDIVEVYGGQLTVPTTKIELSQLSENELAIIRVLGYKNLSAGEIAKELELDINEINSMLSVMELKNYLTLAGSGTYQSIITINI